MPDSFSNADAMALLPEIVLAVGAMVMLMIGVFRRGNALELISSLALVVLGIAAALVVFSGAGTTVAMGGSFIVDTFARFMKVLAIFGAAATVLISLHYLKAERIERFEFPVLVVLATLGMTMMISANGLIAAYLGLELQSLALYVIAAINRDSARSSEAGLKYFVLGALASGMLLYGCSLIYGFTGTTTFAGIAGAVSADGTGLGLLFGLCFLLVGLAFKVSAVPFHMWTPDVYEGAPTPVTAFFAMAPKVAAVALLVRAMIGPFGSISGDWQQILVFLSIASMALGAFAAIGQTNIKRLMAYSSISHMGYALIGLAAASPEGVRGVIIYMTIYVLMTLGTFGCILAMRRREGAVEDIYDLSGLARTNGAMAFVLAMLMFSLAGIPPLAGFFAKFFVFAAAIKAGLVGLAVIGVVTSVVGAYYYLRIVKVMYFDEPAEAFEPMPGELKLVIGLSGVFILAFVLFARPVINAADAAAASLF